MSIKLSPVNETFVARVDGVNLAEPLDEATVQEIQAALHRYKVLIFSDQVLTPEAHIGASRQFGELYFDEKAKAKGREHGELAVFGNVNPLGNTFAPPSGKEQEEWHFDHSYRSSPAMGCMLYARIVPDEGGETLFADMERASDEMPDELRARVAGKSAIHSTAALNDFRAALDLSFAPLSAEQRAGAQEARHPLVQKHPATGRDCLCFGSKVIREIDGLSEAETKALVDDLTDYATQPQFIYSHRWAANELLFWDNKAVVHTGTNYDKSKYSRLMQRTTILTSAAA